MTSPPPPEGRPTGHPTGPPSGPLSEPPHEPTRPWQQPEQPTAPGGPTPPRGPGDGGGDGGGGGGGDGGPGGGQHWWRSAPRVAIIVGAVVVAVVLAVVFTRMGGGPGKGELFLEPAGAAGSDPFTESTATQSGASASPSSMPSPPARGDGKIATIEGSAPGLYGGSRDAASCDVEKQIRYLDANPEKARAFATVEGKDPGALPAYLRSLTSVQLLADTRVTNHGYKDGRATGYQAVLQAGTAVLVDAYGMPRVRCACGNPLTPPAAIQGTPKPAGKPWPGYQASKTVAVRPAPAPVGSFVLLDPETGQYFKRPKSDDGSTDTPTPPPSETPFGTRPPSPSGSTSASPGSPSGSGSGSSTSGPTSPGGTSPRSTSPGSPGSPGSPPPATTGPGTTQGSTAPPQPGTPGTS